MSLIIQKYGGTSVANVERITHIASRIKETRQAGHDVIVVVSAMAGETDRLLGLAREINESPSGRELDVLLSTGEQVTIALLCMILNKMDCDAISYTGWQVPIKTNTAHNKARIETIEKEKISASLQQGKVVVVAGFQGITSTGHISTLGRGGSDTTAVALAAALNADECQILTDVDGVYTADPRIVPKAQKVDSITHEEMLELASLGSKVLQIRSVEFAKKYNITLRVMSSFQEGQGTLIKQEDNTMEQALISGIAHNRDEAKLTIIGVPDSPGIASQILGPISEANIEVDMIVQNVGQDNTTDFTFSVHRNEYKAALAILSNIAEEIGARSVEGDDTIVKISVVGVGMRSHAGIANTMFSTLAKENINIQMISTSEIKISVVIEEKYLELGLRTLHSAFNLDSDH